MFDVITVSTNTYHTFSLEAALKGISRAGFRYLELACVRGWTEHFVLKGFTEADVENLKKKCALYGLSMSSVSGHSDLSKPEGFDNLKKAIDLAVLVGAKVVNTGTVEKEDDLSIFYQYIPELGNYALIKGVKVGLEIHGDVLKNGQAAKEFMEKINHPGIGINYDTGNCIFYGDSRPEEDIFHCLPWIVHIHLKDKIGGYKVWNFPPLGEGTVDFKKIFSILRENKVDVPLSVEIEYSGSFDHPVSYVDECVKKSYDYLQKVIE